MPANLENSAVDTGLEKVSFHSNSKERQCQRMLKLPHNCTYFKCKQSNAQNSPSQALTVCELWTSRCSSLIYKRQREHRSIANICWIIKKAGEFQKNIYFSFIDCTKAFDLVDHNKLWKILKRFEYQTTLPASSVCRSRSNSDYWTWNNRLVPNQERSISRLYIVTLLI